MKTGLILSLATFLFAGCAHRIDAPGFPAAALGSVASPKVRPDYARYVMIDGKLGVAGSVFLQFAVKTTLDTHLDLVVFDGSGRETLVGIEHFEPRDLPLTRNRGTRPAGRFRFVLPPLPSDTVKLLIRAHEGDHGP